MDMSPPSTLMPNPRLRAWPSFYEIAEKASANGDRAFVN
jgi:hypothetical protein